MGARELRAVKGCPSVNRWAGLWLGAFVGAVLAACSAPPPRGNLQYIEPDTYRIENPSKDRALATGIGCAFTVNEAEQRAGEVATFNLRRMTGDARYRIEIFQHPYVHELCASPTRRAYRAMGRAIPQAQLRHELEREYSAPAHLETVAHGRLCWLAQCPPEYHHGRV